MTPIRAAEASVRSLVDYPDPIALEDVLRLAELQTRVDKKYLLTGEQVTALFQDLAADRLRYQVLEIDGRRTFGYESVYIDTPDLATFRDHRQGRRRRFKARTRTYTDSGDSVFEVKLEGRRGGTVKERLPLPSGTRGYEDTLAREFLGDVLRRNELEPVEPMMPVLRVTYRRATLVDPDAGTRLTLDVELRFTGPHRRVAGPDRVIVESKSHYGTTADRVLAAQGIRPTGVSKYCAGIALTTPGIAANRWSRILRREFGWRR